MTDPIAKLGRMVQADPAIRQSSARSSAKAGESSTAQASARPASDELNLSEIARQAMKEPEFDRAKVDAIKQAIERGQYPLDSRRIAESFMAIEKMIKE